MRAAVQREREWRHDVSACGVLVASPMPELSVEEILAVHIRMHKAEDVLFREAPVRAAGACGLRLVAIPEKLRAREAGRVLGTPAAAPSKKVAALGKSVGPPWGRDKKDAALTALISPQKP